MLSTRHLITRKIEFASDIFKSLHPGPPAPALIYSLHLAYAPIHTLNHPIPNINPRFPRNALHIYPSPRSLSPNIHRDSVQTSSDLESPTTKNTFRVPWIASQSLMEFTSPNANIFFTKFIAAKASPDFVTMAVYYVRYDTGSSKLNSKVDEAEINNHGYTARLEIFASKFVERSCTRDML